MGVPPRFELSEEQVGERLVIAARGEIDLATVAQLREAVERAIAARAAALWIDLTEVEFIDSTGLTAVVRAHHALDDGRCRLAVICPGSGPVRRALDVSGVERFLQVFPDRSAAAAGS
jgi:anti-sigma B factor antagonist